MATNHPAASAISAGERSRASNQVTLVSIAVNIVIALAQVIVGVLGHSQGLIADGVHTLSDLLSDFLVLFAVKHAAREADEDHPYGHARYETAATLALGIMLVLVAVGIAWAAGKRLLHPDLLQDVHRYAIWAAAATIIAKEGLYQYTAATGRRVKSQLLIANAWHHRSDAISSVMVLLGILGNLAGYRWLDSAAAIGVALMIGWMGYKLGREALEELVDAGLDTETLTKMENTIRAVPGVVDMHMLRSRKSAGRVIADVHIQVNGRASVSEGHTIGDTVRYRLLQAFPELTDITVHIDPENDEKVTSPKPLPLREEFEKRLRSYFSNIAQASQIRAINLHYLNGKIDVELVLPIKMASENGGQKLVKEFREAAKNDPDIGKLSVLFAAE